MASSSASGYNSDSDISNTIPKLPTVEQHQKLEMLFQEFKNPEKMQIEQWSLELQMDPDQISYWFKTKKMAIEAAEKKEENEALRIENELIRMENMKICEQLKNLPQCETCTTEVPIFQLELLLENAALKNERERLSSLLNQIVEDPERLERQRAGVTNNNQDGTEDPNVNLELELAPAASTPDPNLNLELQLAPPKSTSSDDSGN